MLLFPNAKINIGLNVIEKRKDGFHNVETVFYPIPWCDGLELNRSTHEESSRYVFNNTGLKIDCSPHENLCIRAFDLLDKDFNLPKTSIHLHKVIPFGGGLGGGSADASYTLIGLNKLYDLNLTSVKLKEYAELIGSDCPFFIDNVPSYAEGKGEILNPISLNLKNKLLYVVYPHIHVPTSVAFSKIIPKKSSFDLRDINSIPIQDWRNYVKNDFEESVFSEYPEINSIKNILYEKGAIYASMSGSGASVYAFFEKDLQLDEILSDYHTYSVLL